MLIVSGMVSISLYPFTEATMARPIPVLPLVGSIIVPPGLRAPFCSALSIIESAILSFTEPPGLYPSSFAHTSAPPSGTMWFILTRGVLPIRLKISL